jgi:hypothetical protein
MLRDVLGLLRACRVLILLCCAVLLDVTLV